MSELKFRKKPVVVEAMQWKFVDDAFSIEDWVNIESDYTDDDGGCTAEYDPFTAGETNEYSKGIDWGHLTIETLEGRMRVAPGDWVIKGVKGEFYPCKPDIFAKTYERVEE